MSLLEGGREEGLERAFGEWTQSPGESSLHGCGCDG